MEDTMELFEELDAYRKILERESELKELTSLNNKDKGDAVNRIAQKMIFSECKTISREGFIYSVTDKTHYSKKAGQDELLFGLLRENGLGDIIKETVNANSLESVMRAFVEETGELPQEFEEAIHVYETLGIQRRKER